MSGWQVNGTMETVRRGLIAAAVVAVALGGTVGPAQAQALDLAADGGPVEITADNGIDWRQADRRFTARGNATATRNMVSVRADTLTAAYSGGGEDGGDVKVERIEAHGGVVVKSPSQQAYGDDAVYLVNEGQVTLTGAPVRLVTPTETLTAGKSLEYDTRAMIATARGGATVEQNGRTIEAETLVVHLTQIAGKTEVAKADALGGVVIKTPTETAYGSQGNYDAKTGIATLTGSVKIVRGENVLTGGQATVNLNTGVSNLSGGASGGRARAVLVPEKDKSKP